MVSTKFVSVLALAIVAATAVPTTADAAPVLHPSVSRALRQQATSNIIVTFKQGTKPVLDAVHEAEYTSRGAKIDALVRRLEQNAATSQQEVVKLLSQESDGPPRFEKATSFWITNQLHVQGASAAFVQQLASLDSIAEVRPELVLPLPPITPAALSNRTARANEWGVTKIRATDVWGAGFKGQGIVVSTIDTGVLGTHEALKSSWRSAYGWFDPTANKTTPYDDHGHGTHTMGTIAGHNGIGVAPGVTWMACRACTPSGCAEADLLSCAQFITCPTDPHGRNKDCSKAPRIVSNSWGGGQGETFYKAAVDAWHAAGIIPIFANGNEGPKCGTASSPGDYDTVLAVGATDVSDKLASFSSKGPSTTGLVKPEISAPGVNVRSSWNTGTTAYNAISGTSMATPHVAGVVALLLSAKPGLGYPEIKKLLTGTTDTSELGTSGSTCGGTKDGTYPNNQYGYGRVNAQRALQKAVDGDPTRPPTPTPTTSTPTTPMPTTAEPTTPSPTTPTPGDCATLGFDECSKADNCIWDWSAGQCGDY